MKVAFFISIIVGAIFISALQVVTMRAQTRGLFIHLQDLRKQHDDVDREWSQLLLEQETWSTDNRIEELAHAKLKMNTPAAAQIRRVKL